MGAWGKAPGNEDCGVHNGRASIIGARIRALLELSFWIRLLKCRYGLYIYLYRKALLML